MNCSHTEDQSNCRARATDGGDDGAGEGTATRRSKPGIGTIGSRLGTDIVAVAVDAKDGRTAGIGA